ncbi:MAG: NADH-quinone oxidoreductase subunit C [Proteobacteria bacterium]|nr:NADH-quinone oxidoreductase subunit C [Pseudomonadota bacterium]
MTTTPHQDTQVNLEALTKLQTTLEKRFAGKLTTQLSHRELTVTTAAPLGPDLLLFLKTEVTCEFSQLMSICGVDYLGYPTAQPTRFAVVYHLLSLSLNQRIRVKLLVREGETVPTATKLFASAGWYERETYDMFGIVFSGHPDLRRLLTDYDFVGFPLRKDFPLEGHVEVYYDAEQKRVAYKPVDLPQEFRHFDRISEWEGMTGNAPLAEEDKPFNAEEFK